MTLPAADPTSTVIETARPFKPRPLLLIVLSVLLALWIGALLAMFIYANVHAGRG